MDPTTSRPLLAWPFSISVYTLIPLFLLRRNSPVHSRSRFDVVHQPEALELVDEPTDVSFGLVAVVKPVRSEVGLSDIVVGEDVPRDDDQRVRDREDRFALRARPGPTTEGSKLHRDIGALGCSDPVEHPSRRCRLTIDIPPPSRVPRGGDAPASIRAFSLARLRAIPAWSR